MDLWQRIDEELDRSVLLNPPTIHATCLASLQTLTAALRNEELRSAIPESILCKLLKILEIDEPVEAVTEALQSLRNSGGSGWNAHPSLWLQLLSQVMKRIQVEPANLVHLKISLQFFSNLLFCQPQLATTVWDGLKSRLQELLSHREEKVVECAAAATHQMLRNSDQVRREVTGPNWSDLMTSLIESSHRGILYSQLVVRLYLKEGELLALLYDGLEAPTRTRFLHQFSEFCSDCAVGAESWCWISRQFQRGCGSILGTCRDPATMNADDAAQVAACLEILAKGTAYDEQCRTQLQTDEALLTATLELLRNMDVLGRSSAANYFTPVRDHFADVEPHPALGVKAQLVRLVANLVYGHRVNQDHVRRLDVLASILACCNIDARNPLIQQWSILALRNLLEGNEANQKAVASLTQRGGVQPADLERLLQSTS